METIKRKNGKTYREKVYINGKPVTKCFKRKTDAKNWKQSKLAERGRMEIWGEKIQPDILFKHYITNWIDNKINTGLAKRSIESYQSIIKLHLNPFWRSIELKHINLSDAKKFISILVKKDMKPSRINNIITVLKMICEDAVKDNYLLKNPIKNLNKLKTQKKPKEYWNNDEIMKFLIANKEHEDFYLYQVALNTGMRRGELLGLCWDAVNLSKREIHIRRQLDRYGLQDTTKSKKDRIIKMNNSSLKALTAIKNESRNDVYVFAKKNGTIHNISHFGSRHFKKAIERASIKRIRLHDLRTTFACNWCFNDGNIFALSKILGHSSVKVTEQSYADLHPSYMEKIAGTVEFSLDSTQIAHGHLSLADNLCN